MPSVTTASDLVSDFFDFVSAVLPQDERIIVAIRHRQMIEHIILLFFIVVFLSDYYSLTADLIIYQRSLFVTIFPLFYCNEKNVLFPFNTIIDDNAEIIYNRIGDLL